jgi:hypothetical protein
MKCRPLMPSSSAYQLVREREREKDVCVCVCVCVCIYAHSERQRERARARLLVDGGTYVEIWDTYRHMYRPTS